MMDENSRSDDKEERRKTAAELRKANKPLMEKRRRERINTCLDQLKSILMDVTKKESSFYSKLEKADILEMTVKYLKSLKRQQTAASLSSDPEVMDKYIAGFNECTSEVTSYLNSIDGLTTEVRSRMINHLADCLHRTGTANTSSHMTAHVTPSLPSFSQINIAQSQPLQFQAPAGPSTVSPAQNNVCIISPSCLPQRVQTAVLSPPQALPIQLVPAKLPSGDTVYVLANSQQVPVVGSNINIANSTTVHDFSTQNVNQNVTVLNSVVHGGIMKVEPVSQPVEVAPTITPVPSILLSPSGSMGQPLYFTKSPPSPADDISLTDDSSSSAGPGSSFDLSGGDFNANICVQPSLPVSQSSPELSHSRINKGQSSSDTRSTLAQQLTIPKPRSRTCSNTISRPPSTEPVSTTAFPITTKDNSVERSRSPAVELQQAQANAAIRRPPVPDQTWRPW